MWQLPQLGWLQMLSAAPALVTSPRHSNLPHQRTPSVGRTAELTEGCSPSKILRRSAAKTAKGSDRWVR